MTGKSDLDTLDAGWQDAITVYVDHVANYMSGKSGICDMSLVPKKQVPSAGRPDAMNRINHLWT